MEVAAIESDSNTAVLRREGSGFYFMAINVGNVDGDFGEIDTPLAQDVRVRQALNMAIDRQAINDVVFNGVFEPTCGFVPVSSPLSTPQSQECPPFDPEAARALLEETGYELPIKVELLTDPRPEQRRSAEVIQAMAAEVGFEITIEMLELNSRAERTDNGQYELAVTVQSGRLDPGTALQRQLETTSAPAWIKYSNERVDELFEISRSAATEQEMADAYGEIQQIINVDVPIVITARPAFLVGHRADVTGLEIASNGSLRVHGAAFLAG